MCNHELMVHVGEDIKCKKCDYVWVPQRFKEAIQDIAKTNVSETNWINILGIANQVL